ncbi:MAG: sensor histidine kinase [Vulcanimicrobiaceae bacterium]
MLPILCYGLILAAWILDLVTPQLFIAAILLNVPIALSSLALKKRFTVGLIVAAEIANLVAGYVNALHDRGQFDAIAVGDRLLLAASFLLVGYMAIKTQTLAREAGLSEGRAEQAQRERHLRLAIERVRESLNPELVRRSLLREAIALMGAQRGMLVPDVVGESDWYTLQVPGKQVVVRREALPAEVRSLLAKRIESAAPLDARDIVARYALETLSARYGIMAGFTSDEKPLRLLLVRDAAPWQREEARALQSFSERCANALSQAELFARNVEQATQISEQHRSLLERSAVIRDLVYALAHDLRTPLAAADVTMRQAQQDAYGALPAAYRDVLQASLRSNQEAQRLVETLLLIARYEAGDVSILREPLDLVAAATDVQAELEATAHEAGVVIRVTGPQTTILGDIHEIRRACMNLLANAVAASPRQTQIDVHIERTLNTARLIVEDHGYGVPPEERSALFARFGVGKRRRGSGTGLGLYVVRLIAEKHGGTATYEPSPTGGSRFCLTLPRNGAS